MSEEEDDDSDSDTDMFASSKPNHPPCRPGLDNDNDNNNNNNGIKKRTRREQDDENKGPTLHASDFSDAQGYYRAQPETLLGGGFTTKGELGRGVFSSVVLVRNSENKEFAAKVLRNNDTMTRAGEKEVRILRALGKHASVVELVDSFSLETGNLVIVFVRYEMSLRDALDKFGRGVGLNIEAVRAYSAQLFSALARLDQVGVVHADLKPENILVSSDLSRCVLADFGSAFQLQEPTDAPNGPVPYLVSRFYRAPEIMLGLEATCAVDVWSLSCVIFELFTGTLPAPGRSNNDMLCLLQRLVGRFPNSMVRRHITIFSQRLESEPHFDDSTLAFKLHEVDPVDPTKVVRRLVQIAHPPPTHDTIRARIIKHNQGGFDKPILDLAHLLEAGMKLDPTNRVKPSAALLMDFFKV